MDRRNVRDNTRLGVDFIPRIGVEALDGSTPGTFLSEPKAHGVVLPVQEDCRGARRVVLLSDSRTRDLATIDTLTENLVANE